MAATHFDAIVLGLGGVGSFALRSLARSGARVLGVERFQAGGHEKGSSHGRTRIYRKAYFEHANYVPWLEYSVEQFHQLQREQEQLPSKRRILQECGMLILEPKTDKHDLPPFCQASYDSAIQHGIPVETLSTLDLRERFPQFNYHKYDMLGVLEPGGGFVRPEAVIQAVFADAVLHKNVDVLDHAPVESWKNMPNSSSGKQQLIEVKIRKDTKHSLARASDKHNDSEEEEEIVVVTTNSLLVSCGAWTGQLIPSWQPLLTPIRQVQGWIDTSRMLEQENLGMNGQHDIFSSDQMPCWVTATPEFPEGLYGVPADLHDPEEPHSIKVGTHGALGPVISDPTRNHQVPASRTEIRTLEQAAHSALNVAAFHDQEEMSTSTGKSNLFHQVTPCMYTMTKDHHFLIGSPSEGVFGCAGLSGHGFKQTPALGQMMADFALGKDVKSKWHFDFCSPERFGVPTL